MYIIIIICLSLVFAGLVLVVGWVGCFLWWVGWIGFSGGLGGLVLVVGWVDWFQLLVGWAGFSCWLVMQIDPLDEFMFDLFIFEFMDLKA